MPLVCPVRRFVATSRVPRARRHRARLPPSPRPASGPRGTPRACRTKPGPRAPLPDAGLCRGRASHRKVRAHFDRAGRGRGAARRPLERLVEVGHLNDVLATELLLGLGVGPVLHVALAVVLDRKSTRLNSSHPSISYAVFCLKKKRLL